MNDNSDGCAETGRLNRRVVKRFMTQQ